MGMKIATTKIMPKGIGTNIKEATPPIKVMGKTSFQFEAIVANTTNNKLERDIKAEIIINWMRVSRDSEKIKS